MIDINAILSRVAIASGITSLLLSNMVERTNVKTKQMMLHPPTMPQIKKRACIVCIALVKKNKAYVSLICDTLPPNLKEALDVCIEQTKLLE
jgi:hypothetical protein